MKKSLTLSLAIFLFIAIHAYGKDAVVEASNLGKMSYEDASGTVNEIASQNNKLVIILVDEIRRSDFPTNSKVCAIYLLGELHPKNISATQVLSDDIDFKAPRLDPADGFSRWGAYPAQEALIKIGNPSIPAVIRNLAESDDAKVRELSLQVLARIDGDKDISQLRLQKALKTETNSQKQSRLQAALKSLAEMK